MSFVGFQIDRRLLWIVGLAVAIRLVLLIFLHDSYYTVGMAQGELARNLVDGRGFVINVPFSEAVGALQNKEQRLVDIEEGLRRFPPEDRPDDFRPFIAYMMPGQGILLAATTFITGRYRYLDLQVLQAVLDGCAVLMIFAIAASLFSQRTGLFAALLYALYVPSARLAITATRDAWMPLIFISICLFLVLGWKRGNVRFFYAAGILVAVGSYFRSEILLVPICAAVGFLALDYPQKRMARYALLGIIPLMLLILPWTIRNYTVFDRLIPTNSGLWLAMWQSFGEYENDFGAVNNDVVTLQQVRAQGHTEEFDTPEYDDLFRGKVLEVLRTQPGWFAWTVIRRVGRIPLQMHAWGIPETDEMSTARSIYPTGKVDVALYWQYLASNPLRAAVHAFTRGINVMLYFAIPAFFFRYRRRFWKEGLLLLGLPAYNIAVHAIIGVHARYILPTNALLLIVIAALLVGAKTEPEDAALTPRSRHRSS